MKRSFINSMFMIITLLALTFGALGVTPAQAAASQPAYVHSLSGNAWGMPDNPNAMNTVFGAGNWDDLAYETVNPAVLFSSSYDFIFMDGSAGQEGIMAGFLSANQALIEAWVSNGGRLFLNSAGGGASVSAGFGGVTMNFGNFSPTATAVNPGHVIFNGPFTPAGSSYSGGYFAHDTITGGATTPLMTGIGGAAVLAETAWGNGWVIFGGVTAPGFWSPQPNGYNLYANILDYLANIVLTTAPAVGIAGNGSFGDQPFGTTSAPHTFTVTNTGTADLVIGTLQVFGAEFTTSADTCSGATIAPTGTCTFDVTFTPSGVSWINGSLGIPSNAASSTDWISLDGNGTAPADSIPPVVTVPLDMIVEATSSAGADVSFSATATDETAPAEPVVTCTPPSGSTFPFGTTTVNCSATDAAGNLGSNSFTVTVEDTTAPSLTVPSNMTVEATSAAGAVVNYPAATATDDVDPNPVVACVPASGSTFTLGLNTVNCTATDDASNVANDSFTITVQDTTDPILTVPADMTVEATSAAGRVVSFSATATDTVDSTPTVACVPPSGSTFPLGLNTVNCTATDDAGNIANSSFTITVVDTTDPSLTVPAYMIVNATSAAGAFVNFVATATDAVDPAPVVACVPPSGSLFPFGLTTVNCTATDANHNVANGSFTVTVQSNPNEIVLYDPTNGETLHYNRLTFDWSDYQGATGYHIQLSRNNIFTQLVVNTYLIAPISAYTPAGNLPVNTTLYWRVRARLPGFSFSAWSEVWTFTTANPPSVPTLLSPANNALTMDTTPTLDWSQSSVPAGETFEHYQVQVDDDANFSSPIVDENIIGVTNSIYTLTTFLNTNTKYYWHVRAFNTDGAFSAWSTARYFREAMFSPVLVAPIGGITVGGLKPLLDWDLVLGATSYTIQVSTNNIFTALRVNATVSAPNTFYTPTVNLPAGTVLYWHVRSNGPNGPSAWSAFETFITP